MYLTALVFETFNENKFQRPTKSEISLAINSCNRIVCNMLNQVRRRRGNNYTFKSLGDIVDDLVRERIDTDPEIEIILIVICWARKVGIIERDDEGYLLMKQYNREMSQLVEDYGRDWPKVYDIEESMRNELHNYKTYWSTFLSKLSTKYTTLQRLSLAGSEIVTRMYPESKAFADIRKCMEEDDKRIFSDDIVACYSVNSNSWSNRVRRDLITFDRLEFSQMINKIEDNLNLLEQQNKNFLSDIITYSESLQELMNTGSVNLKQNAIEKSNKIRELQDEIMSILDESQREKYSFDSERMSLVNTIQRKELDLTKIDDMYLKLTNELAKRSNVTSAYTVTLGTTLDYCPSCECHHCYSVNAFINTNGKTQFFVNTEKLSQLILGESINDLMHMPLNDKLTKSHHLLFNNGIITSVVESK